MNILDLNSKNGIISDMDGVIYHGNKILDGVPEFIEWLKDNDKNFLFFTNSSERSPIELAQKLKRLGLDVDASHFYTSALATADFLANQRPGCSAYVIGEPGLINALYSKGISMNDVNPDYVVIGETKNYNYDNISRAVKLVNNGAKLIGTNPDMTGPSEQGLVPATKALVAPIQLSTGCVPYYVGKPNPLMMKSGIKLLGVAPEEALIIGDRMDTDIVAGIESEIDTVLVLSGVTKPEDLKTFPYRPKYIYNNVGDLIKGTPSAI